MKTTESTIINAFAVCLIAFIGTIGFLAFELYFYRRNFRLMTWSLYVMDFIFEIIIPIFIRPMAFLTGNTLLQLFDDIKRVTSWIGLILSLIMVITMVTIHAVFYLLQTSSSYISNSPISSFNPLSYNLSFLYDVVAIILIQVLTIYPRWIYYIFVGVEVLLSSYLVYLYSLNIFHNIKTGAILAGVQISFIVNHLVMAIFPSLYAKTLWFQAVVILACFIIGAVANYYIIYYHIQKIKNFMKMDSDDMNEEYKNYSLDTDESRALRYLFIGFMAGSPHFIDWSLLKFILQNHGSSKVIVKIIQLLSYFPSENRTLSYVLATASRKRDLSFSHRFTIYESYRIKMTRQSSISADASERLVTLRSSAYDLEAELRSFWSHHDMPIAFTEYYAKKVESLRARWEEGVRDYPNNPKLAIEYSRFLVECATQFDDAIFQHQRSTLIESGHNFAKDLAFRSMIRAYPLYIKNGILDFRGNVAKKSAPSMKSNQSQVSVKSSNSASSMSSQESIISIDAELEDAISKQILKNGHLRLALHHSINGRKTCSTQYSLIVALIVGLISIAVLVLLNLIIVSNFQSMRMSMSRLLAVAQVRFYLDLTDTAVFLHAAKESGFVDNLSIIYNIRDTEEPSANIKPYIDIGSDVLKPGMEYNVDAQDFMTKLLSELSTMSFEGFNVYELADVMMSSTSDFTFCIDQKEMDPVKTSLKNIITFLFYQTGLTLGQDNETFLSNMWVTQEMCEVYANHQIFMERTTELFRAFYDDQEAAGLKLSNVLFIVMIAATIFVVIILSVPEIVFIVFFVRELREAMNAIHNITQDAKDGAIQPIYLNNNTNEQLTATEPSIGTSIWISRIVILIILSLGIGALAFMIVFTSYKTAADIINQNAWLYFASNRLTGCTAASLRCLQAIVADTTFNQQFKTVEYMNQSEIIESALSNIELLERSNNNLLLDVTRFPSAFGYDELLDKYNVMDSCVKTNDAGLMHDTYKCASTNQQISIFKNMVVQIVSDTKALKGKINNEMSLNMVHISQSHIFHMLMNSMTRLVELCEITYQSMASKMSMYMGIGIALAVIYVIFAASIVKEMKMAYSTILVLIKRISPVAVMQNKQLIDYILRKSTQANSGSMSISQSVIHNSVSGIMCTGICGVIEIINPAVSQILGYTPEQLLGQPLTSFLKDESEEKLAKQMELMRNGQSATTFEGHLTLEDDEGNDVVCGVVVLGMKGERDSKVTSFVFIFQDESDIIARHKEAEDAKAKSEALLYQILPRDIVLKLNAGEKDICFSVPTATIIFIDIVKFSDYAGNLTPHEIMGNLSLIFAAFDQMCAKYPLLTKIKLIGDVYMAAAGLFAGPDDDPKEHATQTVQFAFDCLTALEDINVKLDASLQVRIGINSGGPILAGVLGTDKPVFDIIGDPINVAARLQSTDIPGHVQISSGARDFLGENAPFDIEPRGEIYLKGKGNQMTYFVSPLTDFMAQLSSRDLHDYKI